MMIVKEFLKKKQNTSGKISKAEMHLIERGKSRANLRVRFPGSLTKRNNFFISQRH
jgi:hypothetical protein